MELVQFACQVAGGEIEYAEYIVTRRDFMWLCLIVLTWGFHAPVMKLGVTLVPAVSLNVARFLGTGLLFLPFARLPVGREWLALFKVAVFFNCGNLMFVYMALEQISSNSFIILIMIAVPFSILLEWAVLRTPFGAYTAAGILVSFCGLVLAFGAPDISSAPMGAAYALMGAAFWSIGSFFMKDTTSVNMPTFLSATSLMAVPIALAMTMIRETGQVEAFLKADPLQIGFVLVYQIGLMSFMMFVWKGLTTRNPAQFVMPFLMLQPFIGVVGAYFMLGEDLKPQTAAGGALILLGLSIIHIRKILKYRSAKKEAGAGI